MIQKNHQRTEERRKEVKKEGRKRGRKEGSEKGRKLHKDIALQPSFNRWKTKKSESDQGKQGHKQFDNCF